MYTSNNLNSIREYLSKYNYIFAFLLFDVIKLEKIFKDKMLICTAEF